MSAESAVTFKDFKGLNLDDPLSINDNELATCLNFDVNDSGNLIKRAGLSLLQNGDDLTGNVLLLGRFRTTAIDVLIAYADTNKIYFSSGGDAWTEIDGFDTSVATWGVQYRDKFYIITSGAGIYVWTGTGDLAAIAGSPSGITGIVHKDRLFVSTGFLTSATSYRLYFSDIGDATDGFDATKWNSVNFIDVNPADGDNLTGLAIASDVLIVFKARSTYGLYVQGDGPSDWTVRNLNPIVGCYSPYSIAHVENLIYFTSSDGVYATDGGSFRKISSELNAVFNLRFNSQGGELANTMKFEIGVKWKNKYIVGIATGWDEDTSSAILRFFVYYYKLGFWVEWSYAANVPKSWVDITDNGFSGGPGIYSGGSGGTVSVFEAGLIANHYKDGDVSYTCRLETKKLTFDLPERVKRGKWGVLSFLGSADVTVTHKIDFTGERSAQYTGGASSSSFFLNTPYAGFAYGMAAYGYTGYSTTIYNVDSYAIKTIGPGYFRLWQLELTVVSDSAFTLYSYTLLLAKKGQLLKAAY